MIAQGGTPVKLYLKSKKKTMLIKNHNYLPQKLQTFQLSPLAIIIICIVSLTKMAHATDTFNVNALEIDNPMSVPENLSQFSVPGGQAPGTYHVDIFINKQEQHTQDIQFFTGKDGKLIPLLSLSMLKDFGVNLETVPQLRKLPLSKKLQGVSQYIPQASETFDFKHQRLLLTVPQSNMNEEARGYVAPQYWDEGISALLMDYSFNGSNTWQENNQEGRADSSFLNLHSGLNLGGWRLRNYSTWSYNKDDNDVVTRKWDSINSWAQHDVKSIGGEFLAGDSYTPSDVFDSLQFRGAQLSSDDNMLPDSLRGYAPTIRGIANSNAKITVRQNNSVIYQSYVPPGAFTINDLYPTSSSGDLKVTITEADGSERTFVQPFSNVPVMQREGRLKYAITAGQYRSSTDDADEPHFGQMSLIYGLPHDVTVYGGTQVAEKYNSAAFGMGFELGSMGSVSVDGTDAKSELDNGDDKTGQSYRFQYSKSVESTDSTITLAGYRYSTSGYYSFSDATEFSEDNDSDSYDMEYNKRSKIQLDLTQELDGGSLGTLSVSAYQQDYWEEDGHECSANVSYSASYQGINYSLMYTYSENPGGDQQSDQQLAFNINIPLSRWLSNAYITTNTTTTKHGDTVQQMGINGTALTDNNLSYSVMQGYTNHSGYSNGQVSGDYKGSYGEYNAGYNYDHDSRQINYGIQGAVIAHQQGITFSQPLAGDITAIALIEAPGASDVKVDNNIGIYTDWRGYAVIPYVNPYKRSRVALDTQTLGSGVDIDSSVQSVTPTAGAVVLAKFKTHMGVRLLLTLNKADKSPVPFGATVTLKNDDREDIVGDNGQVYLTGMPITGQVYAKWGRLGNQQCTAKFTVPENHQDDFSGVTQLSAQCL